jgi:hypothetical protein
MKNAHMNQNGERKVISLAAIVFAFFFPAFANAQIATFTVEHDHLWRSCKGELVFGDATVEYSTPNAEHARAWKYEDIQQLEIGPERISILTYNVRKIELGADQSFNFKVLSGRLTDEFRRQLEAKLSRPLVSSIIPDATAARYTIPARHRKFLDDSQGMLELGEEYVIYRADKPTDSRVWRYDELLSVGSTGPFQLRLGAVKKTGGEYGEEKNYVFDLKRKLEPEEYDFIWEKIHRPKISPQSD